MVLFCYQQPSPGTPWRDADARSKWATWSPAHEATLIRPSPEVREGGRKHEERADRAGQRAQDRGRNPCSPERLWRQRPLAEAAQTGRLVLLHCIPAGLWRPPWALRTPAAVGATGGFSPGLACHSDTLALPFLAQGASPEFQQRPRLRGGGWRACHAPDLRRGCEWRHECLRPRVPGLCGPGLPLTRG